MLRQLYSKYSNSTIFAMSSIIGGAFGGLLSLENYLEQRNKYLEKNFYNPLEPKQKLKLSLQSFGTTIVYAGVGCVAGPVVFPVLIPTSVGYYFYSYLKRE